VLRSQTCAGFTGSIARAQHGHVSTVARRLLSVGGKDGPFGSAHGEVVRLTR
jgi:hypothetical protein